MKTTKITNKSYLFFAIFLTIAITQTSEATPKKFTLDESIQFAKKHNLQLRSIANKLHSAIEEEKIARGALLPNLSINGNYTYTKDLPKSVFEIPGATEKELEFGSHNDLRGGLTLRQPIFAWGRYRYNHQSSKLAVSATEEEFRSAKAELALNVSLAFYRLLMAHKIVEVAELSIDLAEKQLKSSEERLASGTSTNFELLRAKVQLANAKSNFLRSENGVQLAESAFKNLLNLELTEPIELKGDLEISASVPKLEEKELIRIALENRSELKQLQLSERAAEKRVQSMKTFTKPALSFFANYQLDTNEKLKEANKVWNAGLSIAFPFFDGLAANAKVRQAKVGLRQIQLQQAQLRDSIALEIRATALKLFEAKAQIELHREMVAQAKEGVRLAQLQYENGLITSVELTDAQLTLTEASMGQSQAFHDYLVEMARLRKLIGEDKSINK